VSGSVTTCACPPSGCSGQSFIPCANRRCVTSGTCG
jgi:hypothetical protein